MNVEKVGSVSYAPFQDPLDEDGSDDARIVLTRRRLIRLALVASEVGARFEREGIDHDPMAWMLSPRQVFGGRVALDACLELEGCTRALLVHGLGLGLDARPDEIADLLSDAPEDEDYAGQDGRSVHVARLGEVFEECGAS